jgi:hypothetical protein
VVQNGDRDVEVPTVSEAMARMIVYAALMHLPSGGVRPGYSHRVSVL